ncbi:MAG: ribonuclease III [Actinomycetota bacterium]|nr:ribonuclease III [Actinomycetota bacterium]
MDRPDIPITSPLGIGFKDEALLASALTHRSFAFEHGAVPHNERLEFLGDAVLGLIVTDMIFNWYPDLPEGEMAKLRASTVNMAVLADAARGISLGDHLKLGKGEESSGGRDKSSILADAFEALIGAIYLDSGTAAARAFIERSLADHIRDHVERGVVRDFKTSLQEIAAQIGGHIPEYRLSSTGPDHAKRFKALVYVAGELKGAGAGRSKKEAEQAAAQEALDALSGEPSDA